MGNLSKENLFKSTTVYNKTRNFKVKGGTNKIWFGSALSWDATNDVGIINPAGANKYIGLALQTTEEDDVTIEVLNEGEIELALAKIADTPDVGKKVYLADTDNIFDDATCDPTAHTCVGYIAGRNADNWIVRLTPLAGIA